jgi:hypothetical protein
MHDPNLTHNLCYFPWGSWLFSHACLQIFLVMALSGANASEPESVPSTMGQVNAHIDLVTMAEHLSHKIDAVGYSIGGRKYVGCDEVGGNTHSEFGSVVRLNTDISDLGVRTKGGVTWLAMERDYIRHITTGSSSQPMVLAVRHESSCSSDIARGGANSTPKNMMYQTSDTQPAMDSPQAHDLSGEWEILEVEDNRTYRATLDQQGNGPYTWQGGQFRTTGFKARRWQGAWKQTSNDREGEFELVLSEDETEAKGIWWYVRVGTKNNIPPRQHGGSYVWKRLSSSPPAQ